MNYQVLNDKHELIAEFIHLDHLKSFMNGFENRNWYYIIKA